MTEPKPPLRSYAHVRDPVSREVLKFEHIPADSPWSYYFDANVLIEPLAQHTPTWPDPPFEGAVLLASAGALHWRDDRPLEEVRAARWAEIKAQRQALDAAPIEVDGILIDADERSRIDVMGAVVAMQLTGEATRPWRCSDNQMRTLTAAQIQQVGIAIANRRQALIETSDALAQQIQAAATVAAVSAVAWPAPA